MCDSSLEEPNPPLIPKQNLGYDPNLPIDFQELPVLPSNYEFPSISAFSRVYLVDKTTIHKERFSDDEEDALPITQEAATYEILGSHPRIAEYLSHGRTDIVEVKYYPQGDLRAYRNKHELSPELQAKWFQQILEAVIEIHEHHIIHADLALKQFFIDDDFNIRLGDFGASAYPGHPALGCEKASHFLPREYEAPCSVETDLFAPGSTLYELVAGCELYEDLYPVEPEEVIRSYDPAVIHARQYRRVLAEREISNRFKRKDFPGTSQRFGAEIILGYWTGKISSASEALDLYLEMMQSKGNRIAVSN